MFDRVRNRNVLLIGGLFLLLHMVPFWSRYVFPTFDYLNIGATLTYMRNPELFAGNGIVSAVYYPLRWTAPLYYYAGHVLTTLVEPLRVPRLMGLLFAGTSFLLAGGRWSSREDCMRALVVLVVFAHLSGSVNPLLGEKRSATLPVLLFLIHPWFRQYPWLRLGILAVATGIYPPVALLYLVYVFFWWITGMDETINDWNRWPRLGYLVLFPMTFLAVMSPYLVYAFGVEESSVAVDVIRQSFISTDSWYVLFEEFVAGENSALFKYQNTLALFVAFGGLFFLQSLVLRLTRRKKIISIPVLNLFCSGAFLWILAHLVHPMLYQPSRYTRVTLLLVAIIGWIYSLFPASKIIGRWFASHGRLQAVFSGVLLAGVTLFGLSLWVYPGALDRPPMTWNVFWPGLLLGLVIVGRSYITRNQYDIRATAVVALVGVLVMFLPHSFQQYPLNTINNDKFRGLFGVIQSLPRDSVLAGPPRTMNWIPAFGQREVYFNQKRDTVSSVCQRTRNFSEVYYASEAEPILDYLERTPVTHLLVKRSHFRGAQNYRCREYIRRRSPDSVLNQSFSRARWSDGEDWYLLSEEDLRRSLDA